MNAMIITRDGKIDSRHYHKLLRRYYARRLGRMIYKSLEVTINTLDEYVQSMK